MSQRSHAPIFWLLFGAGGMLSALLGTVLVFITGIAVPLGWPLHANLMRYSTMQALARHGLGKAFVLAIVALFAWHAVHRLLCTVHDLGLHKGLLMKLLFYGVALVLTVVTAVNLIMV